jgi:hypothetical protein
VDVRAESEATASESRLYIFIVKFPATAETSGSQLHVETLSTVDSWHSESVNRSFPRDRSNDDAMNASVDVCILHRWFLRFTMSADREFIL